MRVLICGYGSAGRRHAANARDLGHAVVVHDTDSSAAAWAVADGFIPATDMAWNVLQLGAGLPDAVVIATPAATHRDVALRLNAHGYDGPLLVEKPLDVDLGSDVWWLDWPHPTTMVGYNWRWHPEVLAWRASFGTPDRWHLSCRTRMSSWPGEGYASPLLECSHELDILRSWRAPEELELGRVDRFGASGRRLEFGLRGDVVEIRWDASPCRRFTAEWDDERKRYLSPCWAGVMLEKSHLDEMDAFLKAAEKGEAVPGAATFEDGLAVLRIVEQAERMA